MADLALVLRRSLKARPERVFEAWTRPELLVQWWGPAGVSCPEAHVDLREGGAYAIANRTPQGMVWIRGRFVAVEPPSRLVYTWEVDGHPPDSQQVTVRFVPQGEGCEVVVVHERIEDPELRAGHEAGWIGCLDGLVQLMDPGAGQTPG